MHRHHIGFRTAAVLPEVEMDPQLSAEDAMLHAACWRFLDGNALLP
jgi:hypothetical protein